MRKPIKGKEDLVTWCKQNNKDYLLTEWDYEKNELEPEDYFPKSEKTVMWKCIKESHSYPAPICFRTKSNTGCCYCTGKRVLYGFNDLKTWCEKNKRNDLILEWNKEENEDIIENYTRASHARVMWKCCKCGNSYSARIADRTIKSSGCPYCNGKFPIAGKTDLQTWCIKNDREDLINDWNKELNGGKSMDDFTYASDKKVTWRCHICSYEWITEVNARTVRNGGCSKCNVSGTSFPEQFLYLVMKSLLKTVNNRDKSNGFELDIFVPEYKIAIEYNGTYYHSKMQQTDDKKRQLCQEKGIHLLQIYERVKGVVVTGEDIICWKYSREKNEMVILAKDVLGWISKHTDIKYDEKVIEWDIIYKYARVNTYNIKYENSLEYKSPAIAAEWDIKNNDGLKPSQISNGSNDMYNWICKECATAFSMKINDRTGKRRAGCPQCGKKRAINSWIENRTKIKSFYNWCMENNRQDLLNEWDTNRNIQSPQEYPSGSNQEVWWQCEKCDEEWTATIYNRRKSGCPTCARKKRSIAITQYKNGEKIADYGSITEASEQTGITRKTIRKVLQGKQQKACGFEWKVREK